MSDNDETPQQAEGGESAAKSGHKWGDPISEARQAELQVLFARQQSWMAQPAATRGESVFLNVRLTGADVSWLAEVSGRGEFGDVSKLHLEGAFLQEAHLERANLMSAHLEGATLMRAHLEGAFLAGAHLQDATLWDAYLERVDFWDAHLERAGLRGAHLEGADFAGARLEDANLFGASMEGANLWGAHLEGAMLKLASLGGRRMAEADLARIRKWQSEGATNYLPALLRPADLRRAFFDHATDLEDARLGEPDLGYVSVADTHWGGVNLAVVDWPEHLILGDEREALEWKPTPPRLDERSNQPIKSEQHEAQRARRAERLDLYGAATRANRQLASVLRNQGLNDEADRFSYRAQRLHRVVLRHQRRYLRWLWSWFLELLAGYGYEPIRTLGMYFGVVFMFATYYQRFAPMSHLHLSFIAALVMSVASFHGRGFFPTPNVPLDSPLVVMGAMEAIVGLVIEASFIATFTQRFFAR